MYLTDGSTWPLIDILEIGMRQLHTGVSGTWTHFSTGASDCDLLYFGFMV